MRRPGSDNPFHPAVLLALSMTLCGGSLYAANQPGALLQHRIAERASELTAGQRETVAQIIQYLADAAKELQKHDGKAAIPVAAAPTARTAPRLLTVVSLVAAPDPASRVLLHHLDLPPPSAS